MKTILVTGGAGFIGSHVIARLLKENYHVICLDNLNDYYNPVFKKQNLNRCSSKNFHFLNVDITDEALLKKLLDNISIAAIIHLAARAGVRPSLVNPALYATTNVTGTYNMLSIAAEKKVESFIFASSSSVYGQNIPPFKESMTINTPLSPYAATKAAAELACFAAHQNFDVPVTILRLFSVYGPNGRPDMAPYLFTDSIVHNNAINMYGNGSSARDWTNVQDIVDGIILALHTPFPYEIINLGHNKPISLKTLINTIENHAGKKAMIRKTKSPPGEMEKTWADITKAQKLLGWQPQISFENGLQAFVEWFKENRI